MSVLLEPAVTQKLDALFAQAEESSARLRAQYAHMPKSEYDDVLQGKPAYREFYAKMKNEPLAISRETGQLLYILTRSSKAKTIVEFGTSLGVSTLHLAAALRDNGGGLLITSEFEPEKVARARVTLQEMSLADLVDFREGDAVATLADHIPNGVDLLLLDGAKHLYPTILGLIEPKLSAGALVLADNADWCPDYLSRVRSPANGYLSLPFDEDIELSMRLA